jgi:hypothetical protein
VPHVLNEITGSMAGHDGACVNGRCFRRSGILAIVEYVRDDERSPAAAAVVEFLAQYGGQRAYERPDYTAELSPAAGFRDFGHLIERVTLRLSPEAFTGLALSSSHARAAIDALGEMEAKQTLLRMVAPLITGDGRVPYGMCFTCLPYDVTDRFEAVARVASFPERTG